MFEKEKKTRESKKMEKRPSGALTMVHSKKQQWNHKKQGLGVMNKKGCEGKTTVAQTDQGNQPCARQFGLFTKHFGIFPF